MAPSPTSPRKLGMFHLHNTAASTVAAALAVTTVPKTTPSHDPPLPIGAMIGIAVGVLFGTAGAIVAVRYGIMYLEYRRYLASNEMDERLEPLLESEDHAIMVYKVDTT
ncbi:hypothetical protein SDRG_15368 [Saprolegnia diclina VS20]|uniref:Uncharacterized protein n=1 Tax=Saprolegnia diclina (strain VS20) TaxID=1156394 RepID=T0PN67_SAPDV|nr:hypothetical protein SDRG_15368 [Saprolegnia diclina VS20]EQC26859.1 hypothetical protein SDRG_15368 [Saprolegnia diclina VS20]|eukprot:XP_008619761.1 hypothetical protein SDRG_15368 [Saprolegnia diclina VS20]